MKISKKHIFITFGSIVGVFAVVLLSCFIFVLITLRQFLPLVPKLPTFLGFDRQKNYLILFQNNMELFPSGGFIGSYATVSIKNGRPSPLVVHNVYDADGQLKKHIEPHYIVRRFSQVHQYMRSSNFNVDFVKSAQNVIFMYELETGSHADGLVAIDISYIKSIVRILSPIFLWQYNLTITPDNFFLETEYHADQRSFYGSTQKQDFLKALSESMQIKFRQHKAVYIVEILQKTIEAIRQKHVLFELQDPSLQDILTKNNLSSALYDPRKNTSDTLNDFLGVNEANIGVNKSNYYLSRKMQQDVTISPSGVVSEKLTLTYHNASVKGKWPGGTYNPYIRIILSQNAQLTSIVIDGKKQNIIPAITNYQIYETKGFVAPDGLEVDKSEEQGKTIYGFRTTVDYTATQIVEVFYTLDQKVQIQKDLNYNLFVFKQPGTDNDQYLFSLTYPQLYTTLHSQQKFQQLSPSTVRIASSLMTDEHILFSLFE